MSKYEIIIYWSDEDKIFVAEVSELKGCMAHGKPISKQSKISIKQSNFGWKLPLNLAMKFLCQDKD